MANASSLLKSAVKTVVPLEVRDAARSLWKDQRLRPVRKAVYFGLSRYCPICKAHLRRFVPFRPGPDPLSVCPVCYSQGRHRMFWLWLPEKTDLLDGRRKKLLHIAPNGPERDIALYLQTIDSIDYLSGDLSNPAAMVKMDITKIQYPDDTFDVILCSHVLEHVPEDKKAIAELYRVLKPGGWAILQVPVVGEKTFEDLTVTDPKERERLFGQFDHVRQYGKDFKERLERAGFTAEVIPGSEQFTPRELSRYELISGEDEAIWRCRKPAKPANGKGARAD